MPQGPCRDGGSGRARALAAVGLLATGMLGAASAARAEAGGPAAPPPLELALPAGVEPAPAIDPLAITEEMRVWVRRKVPETLTTAARLERLLEAIKSDLQLVYEPWATATAIEVFADRKYNCLAFSHLVVALGRAVGLDAYYLEANGIERYQRQGDLVVLSGHVTAAAGDVGLRRVVDLGVGQYDYRTGRRITDAHALALHYTNLGAQALRAGDLDAALPPLVAALRTEPSISAPWVDLGVALRRRGDLAGAEVAYRRAIAAEPRAVAAYDNLYLLLRARGRDDAAAALLGALPGEARRNPWLLLALGDSCLQAGDLIGARNFYRRARSIAPREAAPAAALAVWHLRRGEEGSARRWWRRARNFDPSEPRLRPLDARFAPAPPTAAGTT
jgi:Flp pilus assembly protein TadD